MDMGLLVLRGGVVALMSLHFWILTSSNTCLLFGLAGWAWCLAKLVWLVWWQAKVKLSTLNFFIGVQSTSQIVEKVFICVKWTGWGNDLTSVQSSRIFTLMVSFSLGLFVRLFCFYFSSLLGRSFRPIVSNLIPKVNLRTVNFSAVNKRIGEDVGAGVASSLFCTWVSRIYITAVTDSSVLSEYILVHRALGPLRRQGRW